MTSDRSEAEERWRRECEEWRVRVGRAEEGERERMDELKLAEQKLACVTQEKTGTVGGHSSGNYCIKIALKYEP